LSVILFTLLLGLSIYLLLDKDEKTKKRTTLIDKNKNDSKVSLQPSKDDRDSGNSGFNAIFVAVYITSILIVGTIKPVGSTEEMFIAWNQLLTSPTHVIQLVAAFLLSFFFPGYALVSLVLKGCTVRSLPKVLFSFLFSMLITGFSVYSLALIIAIPMEFVNPIIIGIDISILVYYIIYNRAKKKLSFNSDTIRSISQLGPEFRTKLTTDNIALFLIFASLFGLIFFYTCYLEKGVIVGDQWFHHGKALLINSGTFKDFATSDAGKYYPPFYSALLAGYFSLSGVPSVNAYVSLNVLNIMAIFGFYYFFSRWVPSNHRKAVVIATTLFVLSSGFGWVLVLNSSLTNSYQSQELVLENLHLASIRSSDVRTPTTFINVGHPTFTSPLIIIGLPAGFVLLGIINELKTTKNRLRLIYIITAIGILGILSHPEFYLFIIITSILILSFRLTNGNIIYASTLLALLFCLLVDFLSPQNYYTTIKILNTPLLILCFVFVFVLWISYMTKVLSRLHNLKLISHSTASPGPGHSASKNAMKIVIVSVLAYLYLFTFVVLQALSVDEIQIQVGTSTQRNIPWYLYPIKFGVVGLLGLAYIGSCIFKRFEKEIFVFGIIAAVSLIAGPYYDEHRFSKYIMVGMVGFASLLLYKIILYLQCDSNGSRDQNLPMTHQSKLLVSSILIGLVITSAGLSIFMLAGYKALAYNNPLTQEDFFRINFPSQSEMNLVKFFRSDLPNLGTNFISIRANDSQTENLLSKLEGFSAVPKYRILDNPQSFDSSTLDGLYSSLHNDNIKYIILPKSDAKSQNQILNPFKFALHSFPIAYQDDTYIVMTVPDLVPPLSEKAETGLVYNKINDLPPLSTISHYTNQDNTDSDGGIYQYDYNFLNNIDNRSKFIMIEKKVDGVGNKTGSDRTTTITMYGDDKPRILWSNPIKESRIVNYVEGKVRLVAENKTRNDFGIKFEDNTNNQQYYVSIDKDSLDVRQKSLGNMTNKEHVLSQNRQLPIEQRALWHTLKILILKDTINVYFDEILKIKAAKSPFVGNFSSISKIGISANKNIAQFEPLKIGYLSESALESYQRNNMQDAYYYNYYPLSVLALSKLPYDTYIDGDFSFLSKRNIILPSDPRLGSEGNQTSGEQDSRAHGHNEHIISEEKFNRYLDFVKLGGTLIVLNADINGSNYSNTTSEGAFGQLLSLRYGDKINFNGILSNTEVNKLSPQLLNFTNISGVATYIGFSNSSDIDVRSYYSDVHKGNKSNYKELAPFAIEKKYGQGKLVLVNIAGYLDSLYKSKNHKFITLMDIPKLIGLESDIHNVMTPKPSTVFTNAKITGPMIISNHTAMTIKTNTLLFDGIIDGELPYNLMITNISPTSHLIQNNNNDRHNNSSFEQQDLNQNATKNQDIFQNITIRGLKLSGPYEVIINLTDNRSHFSPQSSYYNYIEAGIPNGFDMQLDLAQEGYAEFTIISCTNNSYCQEHPIRISDDGEMLFHNIRVDSQSISSLPVYLKSPEITVNKGILKFKLIPNSNNPAQPEGNIVVNGNIVAKIDYVENFNSVNKTGTKTDLTFLKSLEIQGNYMGEKSQSDTLLLPGDISTRAKDKGVGVPWEKAVTSFATVIIIISIIIMAIVIKYYIWTKMNPSQN
jgi:hypothetical protein